MSAAAPLRVQPGAVLPPLREADSPPASPSGSRPVGSRPEILERCETLGIPWERTLLEEIKAEQALRRYLADIEEDCPLWSALAVLSLSSLQSWRVRDQVHRLACEARTTASRGAVDELRSVFQRFIGRQGRDQAMFAEHLYFAYQRILLLQRVRRAAANSRGTTAERLAFLCSTAGCGFDDAAWAICQERRPRRGHRLDAAIRKVREEGFKVPRAETEARSFAQLRRIVRASPHLSRRFRSASRSQSSISVPRRIPLPVDAI
ncbi:MAG: hypothetical protein ACRD1P_12410 [Thermoanaerobaculia bacterium]